MRRSIPILTVLAVVLALVLVACGGSKSSNGTAAAKPVPSPTLSAQQLVQQGLAKTGAQTSASFAADLAVKVQGDTSKMDPVTRALVGQGVTVHAAGKASRSPSATDMSLRLGIAGQTLKFAVKAEDGKAWIQYQGKWYVVDRQTVQGLGVAPSPGVSPGQGLKAMGLDPAAWGTTYRYVGVEDVGGAPTYHVKATVDPKKLAAALLKALDSPSVRAQLDQSSTGTQLEKSLTKDKSQLEQLRTSLKNATADFWIGAHDMLLRKAAVAVNMDMTGQKDASGVEALAITSAVSLSHFGEPVTVTAPAQALPFDQLMNSLFGGLLGLGGGSGSLSF